MGRFLLFLIWPFGSLFPLLNRVNLHSTRLFYLTLFLSFFGFSFIILGDSADIVRIRDLFYKVKEEINLGLTLNQQISRLYVYEEYSDPFAPVFAYLVAFFIGDHRFYIGLLGLIYGFFYANVILFVDTQIQIRKKYLQNIYHILFAFLILIIPIWQLNGIRFWTGTMFVIYILLRYIYLNKSLSPIIFSPFFHSAFLVWAPLLLIIVPLFRKLRPQRIHLIVLSILLIIYYSGYRLEALDVSGFSTNASALEGKMNAYNKGKDELVELEDANFQASWFLTFRYNLEKYLRILIQTEFIIVAWIMLKSKNLTGVQIRELQILLITGILAHLITLHPSPSTARFTIFFNYLIPIFFIKNMILYGNDTSQNIVLFRKGLIRFIFIIIFLFVAVVEIRNGFEFINYALFLGNPFTIYFFGNETPLIEFYHAIFGKFAG